MIVLSIDLISTFFLCSILFTCTRVAAIIMRILISGGGVAGPSLAFWLSKLGHNITLVERWPTLRTTGQQIDLRGPGIQVMKQMGLMDLFRSYAVSERGLQFVDDSGRQKAFFPVNKSGTGLQSFTTDYEIMRGDLCRMLYEVTKDRVKYLFGTHIANLQQHDDAVAVTFSDGTVDRFHLVVGADGQGSRTRKISRVPNAQIHSTIWASTSHTSLFLGEKTTST